MGPASCSARSAQTASSGGSSSSSPVILQPVTAMLPSDVFNEPLFFNRQISQPATNTACPAAFLTPQQKPLMLSAGITKVADLPLSSQLQQVQFFWHFLQHGAPSSAQPQQPLGFRFSRPPTNDSFKMLRQASPTSLPLICNFNKPTKAYF